MSAPAPWRPPLSITARLILALSLLTSALWCGATAYAGYVAYREIDEAFDAALLESAHRLLPLAADDLYGHENDDARAIHRFIEGRADHLSYQLRDAAGRVVLRSQDAPRAPYAEAQARGFGDADGYRLFTDTDAETGLTITVAESTRGRREAALGGARAMLWPLAALIPLNMLAIWLSVRAALRPVLRLSADVAARGGRNLAPLDISGQPEELKPIAGAIAKLVERVRAALDAERAFAANSAHELRTPIAGALAQTQRLVAELADPRDKRRARDVEATLKRLAALAEKLMQLSRADAGLGLADAAIDLLPALDIVAGDCANRLDDPGRIHYARPAGAALVARMDLDAFGIAMRNLIDNAASHGADSGSVEVVVEPGGVVRVVNDGPVVPPETLAGLKRRFARGHSGQPGSGLGLAIVETIMRQSGGAIELFSPARGRAGGFEARLTLGPGA